MTWYSKWTGNSNKADPLCDTSSLYTVYSLDIDNDRIITGAVNAEFPKGLEVCPARKQMRLSTAMNIKRAETCYTLTC
jgi:hypothetical protein